MRALIIVLFCLRIGLYNTQAQKDENVRQVVDSLIAHLEVKANQLPVEDFFIELNNAVKDQNKRGQPRNCIFNKRAQIFFEKSPTLEEEIEAYRIALASISYNLRKCGQSISENLSLLYKGHEPVKNIDTLDKYSWFIEYQIAHMHSKFNDYDEAIYYYLKVIPGLQARNDLNKLSRLYGDLGGAYTWRRELITGLSYIKKGLEAASTPKAYAANYNKIARFYLEETHDLTQARYHLKQLMKSIKEIDENKDSMYESRWVDYYIYQGNYHYQNNQIDSALRASTTALHRIKTKEKNSNYRTTAKLHLQLAKIYFSRNDIDSTYQNILSGLQILNPNIKSLPIEDNFFYAENTFVDLLSLASQLEFSRYISEEDITSLGKAWVHITQARQIHQDLESALEVRASIVASKITSAKLAQIALDILYGLHENGSSQLHAVRDLLNYSKSNYLLKAQDQVKRMAAQNVDQRMHLIRLKDSVQNLVISPTKGPTDQLKIDKRIFEIKKQIDQLIASDKTSIQSNPERPYFEFARGQYDYYVYSNYPNNSIYKIASINEIDSLANSFYHNLIRPGKLEPLQNTSEILYNKLTQEQFTFAPVSAIIADGPLQRIPFEVLRAQNSYLVHAHSFYYPPHIQFLNNDAESFELNMEDQMLILCPKYPEIVSDSIAISMDGRPEHLRYAEKEMEGLSTMKKMSDAQVHRMINKLDLVQYLKASSRLHYCGHATFKNDTAQLIISDRKGDLYTLTHYEIQDLNAQIDQLYLNACQTGLGKMEPGEGTASIARSFMESMGVKNVFYSLWNVRDDIAANFATNIYSNNSDIAKVDLSTLKRDYINSAPLDKQHPYYWAAIQQTQLNISKFTSLWKTIALFTGIILFIFLSRSLFRFYFS